MKTRIAVLTVAGVLLLAWPAAATESGCVRCHSSDAMPERARKPLLDFNQGVHAKAGLTCAACHGGDPTSDDFLVAHGRKSGFLGKPSADEIPARCGACHDDAAKMKKLGAPADLPVGQAGRFAKSVHGEVHGVEGFEKPSCISCHGVHGIRAPSDPASPVNPLHVPATCDRCHGDLGYMEAFTSARVRVDQLKAYRTSVHGKRLAEGDEKVAVCSSCHGAHEILPASNPNSRVYAKNVAETCGKCHSDPSHMKGYEIPAPGGGTRPLPTDQLARYKESVHYEVLMKKGDLSAPTCNDCHGNHGATPPEVRTVANVCGQCHSKPAELFDTSPVRDRINDAGYPGCATCHGHHDIVRPSDSVLEGVSQGHTKSGWQPDEATRKTAAALLSGIRSLEGSVRRATHDVEVAENYGMDMTRARLKLTAANDQLVQSRVEIHAFDPKKMDAIIKGSEDGPGGLAMTAEVENLSKAALKERRFRRQGLAVALAIILVLMVALVMKIRRIDAAQEGGGGGG